MRRVDLKNFRPVEEFLVAALMGLAAWLRFSDLGRLGLWGDEGFTYLAVQGILKQGWPLLPSGHPYLKNLFFTYLTAIPCALFGLTEWALRSVNSLCGVALIPVLYFVGKKYLPRAAAFLAAALLAFSPWEIEFTRHARYYCMLQLFYVLALHFFYLGFVEENKKMRKWAILFFMLTTLTHQLGYTLVFSFLLLGVIKSPRVWFQRGVFSFGLFAALWIGAWQFGELFFWKVGSVAHFKEGKAVSDVLFRQFHWGYFNEFYWLFPKMSWVALGGALFYLGQLRREPLGFWAGMGILCLLFMGCGQAHVQPRYIIFLYPIFLLAYAGGVAALYRVTRRIFQRAGIPWGRLAGMAGALALLGSTAQAWNPRVAFKIPREQYGQRLIEKFQPSTTLLNRTDFKTTGQYARDKAAATDLIVGMHMIYTAIYAGRCDAWLWSSSPGPWDAYEEKNGKLVDRYLGIPLIRDIQGFKALLAQPRRGQIWLVTMPDQTHLTKELKQFLKDHPKNIQYESPDGVSKVYLFP